MSRRIPILISVLVVLGLIVLFIDNPLRDTEGEKKESFFPGLKKEDVAAIEIDYFIQGTRFEKQTDGTWSVQARKTPLKEKMEKDERAVKSSTNESLEKFPAELKEVDNLLNRVLALKKDVPISTNPQKRSSFQINDAGLSITFFDTKGQSRGKLLVGKQGPSFLSSYVSLPGSSEVYLVDELLPGLLNRPLEDWKQQTPSEASPKK